MAIFKSRHYTVVEPDGTISFAKREKSDSERIGCFSNLPKGGIMPTGKGATLPKKKPNTIPLSFDEVKQIKENLDAFNAYLGKYHLRGGMRNTTACRLFLLQINGKSLSPKHFSILCKSARAFV